MKKNVVLFIVCCFVMSFSSSAKNSEKISFFETSFIDNSIFQNWYAVTGVTRNSIGTNYSISIRVKGSKLYDGCVSISEVQVSNGGNWTSTRYSIAIGENCTYYVNVGGKSYYFSV